MYCRASDQLGPAHPTTDFCLALTETTPDQKPCCISLTNSQASSSSVDGPSVIPSNVMNSSEQVQFVGSSCKSHKTNNNRHYYFELTQWLCIKCWQVCRLISYTKAGLFVLVYCFIVHLISATQRLQKRRSELLLKLFVSFHFISVATDSSYIGEQCFFNTASTTHILNVLEDINTKQQPGKSNPSENSNPPYYLYECKVTETSR